MMRKKSKGKEIITQCCACQKILDKQGKWQVLDEYWVDINQTLFSHSVCPVCLRDLYPEYASAIGLNP